MDQVFNDADRLKSITDWNDNETTFGYDSEGNLTTETLPNGITDTYGYDNADNLTTINDTTSTSTVFSAHYTLNADEQVSADSSQASSAGNCKYNALDQLCYAGSESSGSCSSPPSGADAYGYGLAGNLTNDNGTTQSYNAGSELCWTYGGSSSNDCSAPPTGRRLTTTTITGTARLEHQHRRRRAAGRLPPCRTRARWVC